MIRKLCPLSDLYCFISSYLYWSGWIFLYLILPTYILIRSFSFIKIDLCSSIFFTAGARIRCVAQAFSTDGSIGIESYSDSVVINPTEGLCMPRRASDVGAESFSAQVCIFSLVEHLKMLFSWYICNIINLFLPNFPLWPSWKHQKTKGFSIFSWDQNGKYGRKGLNWNKWYILNYYKLYVERRNKLSVCCTKRYTNVCLILGLFNFFQKIQAISAVKLSSWSRYVNFKVCKTFRRHSGTGSLLNALCAFNWHLECRRVLLWKDETLNKNFVVVSLLITLLISLLITMTGWSEIFGPNPDLLMVVFSIPRAY